MQNPFLLGEHIYLRPFEKADAAALTIWVNDQEVTRSLLMRRPMNTQNEEEFIEHARKSISDVVLGIVIKDSDRLIGSTGLHHLDYINRHCMFGIMIGEKEHWGKGFGTEATRLITGYALETLNMNRIWLHVNEFNSRGIRAYEKVGYKKEGVLRQHTYREGRYWDVISMGINRSDWQASA